MRHTKRSLEGYYLIDDRASGGALQEYPIVTCAHCHSQIVLNPGRTRDRAECPQCDKYICDGCAFLADKQIGKCLNFQRHLDDVQRNAFRELSRNVTVDPRIIKP